jgi:predicted transcriptional regulator
VSYLRDLANDPLLRTLLNAPFDDEPWTAEDEAALEEAREDVRAGRVVSHEEVVRSLRERQ